MDLVDFCIYDPGWSLIDREIERLRMDYLVKAARSRSHDDHTCNRGAFEALETLKSTLSKVRRDTLKEP